MLAVKVPYGIPVKSEFNVLLSKYRKTLPKPPPKKTNTIAFILPVELLAKI